MLPVSVIKSTNPGDLAELIKTLHSIRDNEALYEPGPLYPLFSKKEGISIIDHTNLSTHGAMKPTPTSLLEEPEFRFRRPFKSLW